jgi:hypothetical protein
MAQPGGLLAAAILKVVGDQIGSAIGGQIKLQKNLSKDLEKMKMALESVEAVLDDAERRSITDKSTCLWLKRLKDAMYVIADMIDEFESDPEAITKPSARKVCVRYVKHRPFSLRGRRQLAENEVLLGCYHQNHPIPLSPAFTYLQVSPSPTKSPKANEKLLPRISCVCIKHTGACLSNDHMQHQRFCKSLIIVFFTILYWSECIYNMHSAFY